jgi:hypothetical protein
VVQDAIEHCCGHRGVAGERGVPLCEGQVARDDDRAALVAVREQSDA